MRTTYRSEQDLGAIRVFNMTTVTVAELYLATHSVMVTLIATVTASLLAGCVMRLPRKQNQILDEAEHSSGPMQRQTSSVDSQVPDQIIVD
jgi:hypothetical protein